MSRRSPRSHLVAEAGVVLLLVLAVVLAACSGDPDDSSGAAPSGEGAPADEGVDEPAPLTTTVELGQVRGKLPQGKRDKVSRQVARAVDAWFDAAYVGGDYPRTDYSDSWPGFTTGAKADAEDDKSLMSNSDVGRVVTAVEALKRQVSVDVLAVKGHAQGATARFVLKFRTTGDAGDQTAEHKTEVRGRLFLTPSPDGWRIFGYDVTKGAVA